MKRLISLLLTFVLFAAFIQNGFAVTPQSEAAEKLHLLGLFQGVGMNEDGTVNFELDRAPTRNEAITMLVRLLGKESEAKESSWDIPFNDVDDWAVPYVGYAFKNNLTSGTSAETFGGNESITAAQYITFVLRALGYSTETDFEWDKAWLLSDVMGITDGSYHAETTIFTRGNAASISFDALSVSFKTTDLALYQSLLKAGCFSESDAILVGLMDHEINSDPATKNVLEQSLDSAPAELIPSSPIGNSTSNANNSSTKRVESSLINIEFGPFTLLDEDYFSNPCIIHDIYSFIMLDVKYVDSTQEMCSVETRIAGNVNDTLIFFELWFYNSNDELIGKAPVDKEVEPGVDFDITHILSVPAQFMENAAYLKFYTFTGNEATR